MYGDNIKYSEKQDIVTNMEFEAIIPSIKNDFFHQHMMNFVNKIELSYEKYQTNGNVIDEKYKGSILFHMKELVLFGTDLQSMYFMSTRFLK